MSILYPDLLLRRVHDITPEFLNENHIAGLLLDVDNTLALPDDHVVPDQVKEWVDRMKAFGVKLMVVSNNSNERVKPFAEKIGLRFVANALKPLPCGMHKAAKLLGLPKKNVAVVGDQIFTDTLAANLLGCTSILVEPMVEGGGHGIEFRRKLEVKVLHHRSKKYSR